MNNGAPEPDLIINHLNQNHYISDRGSDCESDHPSGPADHHENHTGSEPQELEHRDEEENGRPQVGEQPLGSEGGMEVVLVDDQPPRYLSPAALKKHIHNETMKINGELRALITKEIRKPGRRMYNKNMVKYWLFSVTTQALLLPCLISNIFNNLNREMIMEIHISKKRSC